MNQLFEALLFGLLTVLVGTIVAFLIGFFFSTDLPPVCKDWNKNYVMETSLFFTGVFAYLISVLIKGSS